MTPSQSPAKASAWQNAIERHLNCLSASQRKTFVAPADPDDCLELIRQAQGRKKYDRFMVALRPLIEPLKRFEGCIDVLVQAQSGIASPIWGPLRMVVTLISDRLKTLQNLVVLLDRIVDPLKRFANYDSLFRHDEHLQNAIAALYCDLLEFCSRVIRYYSRSSFLNVFSSFDKDLLEVSDNIRHHWTEIDIVANAANIEEAKKAREAEQIQRKLDIRRDINRWLSPSNVSDDLTKHLSECMEGSCEWLVEDPALQKALTTSAPSATHIFARPGAGKTTAAAFLIRYLAECVAGTVLYFFCKASDAEKRTTLHILRSLLWQCLQYDGGPYSALVRWYYQSGRSVADSQTDVAAMFDTCVQTTATPAIFIVIDALDECLDRTNLLLALSRVMAASCTPLKLIILSRDEEHLPDLPSSQLQTIQLTTDRCRSSIHRYVKKRLRDIESLGGARHDEQLAESISNAAGGLWLFARVLLDELGNAPSWSEVERQISGLPHGLRSLYSSIMTRKEQTFSEVRLRMAQELFLWIDMTEYMPEELRWDGHGDCLEDETICTILHVATGSRQLFNPPNLVRELASPLLEVQVTSPVCAFDQDGVPYQCTTFAVDFFHQTVPQYLRWTADATLTGLPESLRPRRLACLHRGVTAACYLCQSEEFQGDLQRLRERPRDGIFPNYLEMVYGLWGAMKLPHLRSDLDATETAQAGRLCDRLTQFLTTDRCLGWIEAAIIINYGGRWMQLIDNVEDVLEIATDPINSTPAFQRFHSARQALMADYAYVLASTWRRSDLASQTAIRIDNMPHGFYQRPLARKIMALARQYQWLLTPAQARSSNCFSIDGRA